MASALHYPTLAVPPGWTYRVEGSQLRLSAPAGGPPGIIMLGPVLGRSDRLPPPARLIEQALGLEEELRFTVTSRGAPREVTSETGLSGVAVEVAGYVRPAGTPERRVYIVYADARCYYSITYLAPAEAFAAGEEAFLAAARSLQPFEGAVLLPPEPPRDGPVAPSPMSGYED